MSEFNHQLWSTFFGGKINVRLVTATALAGMALFVTGDKRVLSWQSRTGPAGLMHIASPRQAWQKLFGVGT
jgi:hypothetical protein